MLVEENKQLEQADCPACLETNRLQELTEEIKSKTFRMEGHLQLKEFLPDS